MTEIDLGIRETCGGVEGRQESLAHLYGLSEEMVVVPGELRVGLLQSYCCKVGAQ